MKGKYSKSVMSYSYYKILFLSLIIDPIIIIYALDSNIDISKLFIILSVQSIIGMIFEIPTGVIADVNGPKRSIILGSVCFTVACLIFIFFPTLQGFFVAYVFIGFYKNFISGADSSYLYLALENEGKTEEYSKIAGGLSSINFAITAVITVVATFLYDINSYLPFGMGIFFATIALLVFARAENFIEEQSSNVLVSTKYKKYAQTIKSGYLSMKNSNSIKWFIIYSMIMAFLLGAIMSLYQLHFKDVGLSTKYVGIIYTIGYFVSSISSRFAYKFKNIKNKYSVFVMFIVLMITTGIGMSFGKLAFVWVVFIPRFIIGVYPTLINDFINKEIIESRSTILSFREFSKQLPSTLLMPIIGKIIGLYGLQVTLVIYAIIAALSTVLIVTILKRNKMEYRVEENNNLNSKVI